MQHENPELGKMSMAARSLARSLHLYRVESLHYCMRIDLGLLLILRNGGSERRGREAMRQ
jgi:hypothetical protein